MKNFLLRIFKYVDAYECEFTKIYNEIIFISFQDDGVYINMSKFIDKRATLQVAIIKLLIEKHTIGTLYSTNTGLNTLQISSHLEKCGFRNFDLEKHVRQSIYRIRKNSLKKYGEFIANQFIESSKLNGQYKLGKNVVLICQKMA